ncbi:MAG: DUF502 domain-containing protein [Candidatus Omnitrophica bacterium]|jgi:uncharacterized membrane protein|nr:DUF502 domain-containing protein [Candidatus Omnitrophota bacterium]
MQSLKRYFITGLAVVVPIFLTIYVLVVVFQMVDGILGRFLNVYLKETLGFYIPGLGLLLFLLVILFIGFMATRFIGKKIYPQIEKWFASLPLVNKIYPTLKQIIQFIMAQKEFGFKKVVLVEYPSKGIWSLGFLTNENFQQITSACGKEMAAVFLSTTPGPFSGYVVFFPKEEIKFLDISITDALKIIISGGVFKP